MTALLDTSKLIVGQSGSGKTVTAKYEVQQLLEQQRHVAVIDPTGVWYGLRSNAAGDGAAFDIPIFGGAHGDLPIRPTDGGKVARIIIEQRVSAIVDLSAIDNSEDWRLFAHDFVAELRRKPQGNFHIVIDEADEFAAQTAPDAIGFRLRENMAWIAKRGRSAGFVPTYITQRPAEIAKAVISQVQTIVAHQLILPHDQKAIDDYLKGHGSPDTRKTMMASLAELQVGERWVYSPRLKILERGTTPALTTFDSSRTPAPGEQLVEPRTLAQLDVSAIREALAPERDAESQKAGKPESQISLPAEAARIAELEAIVADQRAELEHLREVDAECDGYTAGLAAIDELVREIQGGSFRANLHRQDANPQPAAPPEPAPPAPNAAKSRRGTTIHIGSAAAAGGTVRGAAALQALVSASPGNGLTEEQWAFLADFARKGGTWSTYRSSLRAAGLIEEVGGRWLPTQAGYLAADAPVTIVGPGPDLVRRWAKKQPSTGKLAEALLAAWPLTVTRDDLAGYTGMTSSGGTFTTYLGRLRGRGMLEERGKRIRLNPALMEWQ